MFLRVPAAVALALCVLLAWPPGPASAHATLVRSDPRDGASLPSEPRTVSVTFNEDVATPAQLQVTAPDGTRLADGQPTIDGATVTQPLRTSGQAGDYTLAYRVVSADGHPVSGEVTYDVTSGEQTESAHAADPESFLSRHGLHVALGAGAVVIAAVLLAWPWIRRRV